MIIVAMTNNNKVEMAKVFNELNYMGVANYVNNQLNGLEESGKAITFEDVRDSCQNGSLHIDCENITINIFTV